MTHTAHLLRTTAMIAIALNVGCAPILWSRPGTPVQQAQADLARCRLVANATTAHDPAAWDAAGSALGTALLVSLQRGENFNLCMQANGYEAVRQP